MILGVEGSPRLGGNSHKVLDAISASVKEAGMESFNAHLRDYRYEPCVGCEKCRKDKICTKFNDGMTLLYPKIQEAKGLVLISPVHNYNVTAWVKSFVDRLYCFYDFEDTRPRDWSSRLAGQGKKAVICAIAEQASKKDMGVTLEAMRMPLEALGFEIVTEIAVLNTFDRGLITKNHDAMENIQKAGQQLVQAIQAS